MRGTRTSLLDLGKSFEKLKTQMQYEKETASAKEKESHCPGLQLDDQPKERAGEEWDTPGNQEILKP